MAVYKRTYKPYSGRVTPGWPRFLVLTRYGLEKLLKSRILLLLLFGCSIPMLVGGFLIYLRHNLEALTVLRLPMTDTVDINNEFFYLLLSIQSLGAFFVTVWAGPGLISPDLANNALPLYLCRPISRAEYVLGKFTVLAALLSLVTWIPGLILFTIQSQLETGWFLQNLYIGGAIFLGSALWIVVLGLLALALSAWVKWRLAAGGLLFGVFFVATAFGHAINEVMRTKWGHILNVGHLFGSVWMQLFRTGDSESVWAMFDPGRNERIPPEVSAAVLAILICVCLWILNRRLQAREVVK